MKNKFGWNYTVPKFEFIRFEHLCQPISLGLYARSNLCNSIRSAILYYFFGCFLHPKNIRWSFHCQSVLNSRINLAVVVVRPPHISHCVFDDGFFFLLYFSSSKLYIENVTLFRFVCTFVPLLGMHSFSFFTRNDQWLYGWDCTVNKNVAENESNEVLARKRQDVARKDA